MSINNKITTKSYFIKRLRDSGYLVDKLNLEYHPDDNRRWSVLLDNRLSSILITNYKDNTFSFYDGDRFVSSNFRLSTDSIEVVVIHLNSCGIVNKHSSYGSRSL